MNIKYSLSGLCTVLLALGLAACGGGDDKRTIDVSDSFADANMQGATLCLDTNRNLACDVGEDSTVVHGSNARLTTKASTDLRRAFLVAEFPADSDHGAYSYKHGADARPFVLAAPADGEARLSAQSTLVAAQMLKEPAASAKDAAIQVERALGVRSAADLDSVGGTLPGETEAVLLAAWRHGLAATFGAASGDGRPDAVKTIAQALLDTASKYVDPDTKALLPTVTARTLINELLATVSPTRCAIDPLPVLRIETKDRAAITSKKDYVKAVVMLESTDAHPEAFSASAGIRGRGNSTWGMPKKPYRLKLDKKAPLLGMSSDKDWALLANYADKTMLRNAVAFCMGKMLHMEFTPSQRFVELTLNDDYKGVYQLTEHIKVAEHRVAVGDVDNELVDANAGFLLEIDARLDETYWFRSASAGVPYTIKSDASSAQADLIRDHVNAMERTLSDRGLVDPLVQVGKHVDMEALVDFYLINEFMRNNDSFWSSTYVHRAPAGRLVFGPLWDFDIAAGNIDYNGNEATAGWWVRNQSAYIRRLVDEPAFEAHLAARWAFLQARLPELQKFIDESASTLEQAQTRNFQKWNILGTYVWPNAVVTGSYAGEVAYLKAWLDQRAIWIEGEFARLRAAAQ